MTGHFCEEFPRAMLEALRARQYVAFVDVVDTDGADAPVFMLEVEVVDGSPSNALFRVSGDTLARTWREVEEWADTLEVLDTDTDPHTVLPVLPVLTPWRERVFAGASVKTALSRLVAEVIDARIAAMKSTGNE
jgi:hypothetical protein